MAGVAGLVLRGQLLAGLELAEIGRVDRKLDGSGESRTARRGDLQLDVIDRRFLT